MADAVMDLSDAALRERAIIECYYAGDTHSPTLTCPGCDKQYKWSVALRDAARAEQQVLHRACPCLHIEPCDPRCACVSPYSSRGCVRCCSYGSKEQQKSAAGYIAAAIRAQGKETK